MMPELMKQFDEGRQKTVWLGSLAIALTFFLCPLGSVLCKTIGCRLTVIAGCLTCAVGLLLTSYSCSFPLMFFTYSFLFGLGDSLIFMASFLITAKNFRKYQALAVGVVSVGGSVGVLVMGPFLQLLLDTVGWRATYRITSALLCLVTVCGASYGEPVEEGDKNTTRIGLLQSESLESPSTEAASSNVEVVKSVNSNDLKTESFSKLAKKNNNAKEGIGTCKFSSKPCASRTEIFASNGEERTLISVIYTEDADISDMKMGKKKETGKLMDFSVFKVPSFTIVVISLSLMCLGHYTPQLHLVKHCLEIGISADSASKLFIFLGLASSVSRVMTGRLCDIPWINTIFVYQFGNLLVAFMTIALPLLKDYTGILAFAVVYGVGDGIFITTMNSLLMFTVDEKRRAAALGLGSCLLSLGIAGGPPLAGFLADTYDGYMWSFTVAGIVMQFAGILPVVLLWHKKKEAHRSVEQKRLV
ncbi:monocarboxylate transporter 10-like isoform X2 [Oculina patagonica]